MIFLLLIVLVCTLTLYFLRNHYEYWEKRGVPGPKPSFIVGNMFPNFLMKKSLGEIFTETYHNYPDASIVGMFRASVPTLLIRDPEFLKDITIKDFSSFHDNELNMIDKDKDPIFGRNPFCLSGEEWKTVRAQLTPCFTSGRMKSIYPLLQDNSRKLIKYLEQQSDSFNGNGMEAKEFCTKFTLNNVGSCAFGLDAKCFKDPNSEFRQLAHRFLSPSASVNIKLFLTMWFPILMKIIKIKFTPQDVEDELQDFVKQTIKNREENNVVRHDFLHYINQLKQTCKDYEFTDVDVTAHAAGFFGDGFETSSVVMSFLVFQLAKNPEKQAKLREELREKADENGDFSYEALQEMSYLDACLCESLRIYPPALFLSKLCTKEYIYTPKPEDGITKPSVVIEKDTIITIPIGGLHNDAKYFDNPEKYEPKRFLGENREKLTKYTYMPFGEGPRACLGQRFGILQIKTGIAYLINNYELSVNTKTKLPLKFDPIYIMLSPIGGFWINLKKINESN